MMPRVSASIRQPLKDEIAAFAKKMGVTQSFAVSLLLEKAVEAMNKRAPRLPHSNGGNSE